MLYHAGISGLSAATGALVPAGISGVLAAFLAFQVRASRGMSIHFVWHSRMSRARQGFAYANQSWLGHFHEMFWMR